MDLRSNKITLGELLDHPSSRAVFSRRFPMLLRHPMLGAARTVTLEQVIAFAGAYLPQAVIADALRDLAKS